MKRQAGKDILCRGNIEAPPDGDAVQRKKRGMSFFFNLLQCKGKKREMRVFFNPWGHRVRHD